MPPPRAALKGARMKMNIEIECTPEEARRALGLPDLTPLHDRYVQALSDNLQRGITPETVEAVLKNWAPMGEAGLAVWRRLFEAKPNG
jgi:hypothetical protein